MASALENRALRNQAPAKVVSKSNVLELLMPLCMIDCKGCKQDYINTETGQRYRCNCACHEQAKAA